MQRRVVVTGLGPVSSIGIGKESFWVNSVQGKGYFRNVDFQNVELDQYRSRVFSPIDNLDLSVYFEKPKKLKRGGKATQYTVLGAYLAFQDAGFKINAVEKEQMNGPNMFSIEGIDPMRAGAIIGQSESNVDIMLIGHIAFLNNRGPKRINPFTFNSFFTAR